MPENTEAPGLPDGGETSTVAETPSENKEAIIVPETPTTSGVADLIADHISSNDPIPPSGGSGEAPKPGRGRPPKYATDEERKEAKRINDLKRRARSALPPKSVSDKDAVGEQARQSELKAQTLDSVAKMSANMVFNLGVMVFGDPLGVPGQSEKEGMLLGFRTYYEQRGIPNIPPEIGLAMVVIAYAGPRLRHEAMKGKMQRLKEWVNGRFGKKRTEAEVMQ